jgi:hypothetical protein
MIIRNVVEGSGSSLHSTVMFGLRGVKFSRKADCTSNIRATDAFHHTHTNLLIKKET